MNVQKEKELCIVIFIIVFDTRKTSNLIRLVCQSFVNQLTNWFTKRLTNFSEKVDYGDIAQLVSVADFDSAYGCSNHSVSAISVVNAVSKVRSTISKTASGKYVKFAYFIKKVV